MNSLTSASIASLLVIIPVALTECSQEGCETETSPSPTYSMNTPTYISETSTPTDSTASPTIVSTETPTRTPTPTQVPSTPTATMSPTQSQAPTPTWPVEERRLIEHIDLYETVVRRSGIVADRAGRYVAGSGEGPVCLLWGGLVSVTSYETTDGLIRLDQGEGPNQICIQVPENVSPEDSFDIDIQWQAQITLGEFVDGGMIYYVDPGGQSIFMAMCGNDCRESMPVEATVLQNPISYTQEPWVVSPDEEVQGFLCQSNNKLVHPGQLGCMAGVYSACQNGVSEKGTQLSLCYLSWDPRFKSLSTELRDILTPYLDLVEEHYKQYPFGERYPIMMNFLGQGIRLGYGGQDRVQITSSLWGDWTIHMHEILHMVQLYPAYAEDIGPVNEGYIDALRWMLVRLGTDNEIYSEEGFQIVIDVEHASMIYSVENESNVIVSPEGQQTPVGEIEIDEVYLAYYNQFPLMLYYWWMREGVDTQSLVDGMMLFATDYEGQLAGREDLRLYLETATGVSLDGYWEDWLETPVGEYPDYVEFSQQAIEIYEDVYNAEYQGARSMTLHGFEYLFSAGSNIPSPLFER